MSHLHHVHLVDSSVTRRAQLAREIAARGLHTEIYETVAELRGGSGKTSYPRRGAVLISDNEGADLAALLADMRRCGCFLPLIAFTGQAPDVRRIVGALHDGATDYLCFPEDLPRLGAMMDTIIPQAARAARHHERRSTATMRVARLSRQEYRVLEFVIGGLTSKETARAMGLSSRTVEIYRSAVLSKLEVATSAGAIATGIAAGITAFPEDLAA